MSRLLASPQVPEHNSLRSWADGLTHPEHDISGQNQASPRGLRTDIDGESMP